MNLNSSLKSTFAHSADVQFMCCLQNSRRALRFYDYRSKVSGTSCRLKCFLLTTKRCLLDGYFCTIMIWSTLLDWWKVGSTTTKSTFCHCQHKDLTWISSSISGRMLAGAWEVKIIVNKIIWWQQMRDNWRKSHWIALLSLLILCLVVVRLLFVQKDLRRSIKWWINVFS